MAEEGTGSGHTRGGRTVKKIHRIWKRCRRPSRDRLLSAGQRVKAGVTNNQSTALSRKWHRHWRAAMKSTPIQRCYHKKTTLVYERLFWYSCSLQRRFLGMHGYLQTALNTCIFRIHKTGQLLIRLGVRIVTRTGIPRNCISVFE